MSSTVADWSWSMIRVSSSAELGVTTLLSVDLDTARLAGPSETPTSSRAALAIACLAATPELNRTPGEILPTVGVDALILVAAKADARAYLLATWSHLQRG